MTTEDKKQVASQAYALKHFKGMKDLTIIKEAWSDGFEVAKEMYSPKWINVETELPDDDRAVVVFVDNLETPEWSCKKLGSYINNNWYCDGGRKSYEIVVKWMEISQ